MLYCPQELKFQEQLTAIKLSLDKNRCMCCDDARRKKTFYIGINISYKRTIRQKPKYCRETADRRATSGSNFFFNRIETHRRREATHSKRALVVRFYTSGIGMAQLNGWDSQLSVDMRVEGVPAIARWRKFEYRWLPPFQRNLMAHIWATHRKAVNSCIKCPELF